MTTVLPNSMLQLAQQGEDRLGVARVEVAGRLVGDDEVGVGDDGARDGDALLLAARQRARVVVEAVFEADDAQRRLGAAHALGLVECVSSSGSATLSRAESTGIRLKNWKISPTCRARQRASSSSVRSLSCCPATKTSPLVGPVDARRPGSAASTCPIPTDP